ncbi:MAG: hypothetical protein WC635_10015 [Bacteriovorax sp.]|jgi:hypothetical protein
MKIHILLMLSVFLLSSAIYAGEELIVRSETEFIPTHENRFTLMPGVNPSMQKAGDITNINLSYAKKMEDYWLDFTFGYTSGIFGKLTTNNATATTMTDDQLTDTKSNHTQLGIGVGRETRYSQTLLPFTDIYEMMTADLTYNLFKEPTGGKSFSGPGMLAKFSVYKKFSEYFSAGTQFTYNLAVVKRSQEDDTETSSARSLTISYLTIGFDLSWSL